MKSISITWTFITISLYFVYIAMIIVADEYHRFNSALVVTALSMTFIAIIRLRKNLVKLSKDKYFKNICSNIVTILLILGIIGLINYISVKKSITFDVTKNKIHSLSKKSLVILEQFNEQMTFNLYAKRSDWRSYSELIQLYTNKNKNINLKMIDIELNPALVKLNKISANGTLLIEYKGKKHQTLAKDELAITKLLSNISNKNTYKIAIVEGHKELDINETKESGLNYLAKKILQSSYSLQKTSLIRPIDSDIDLLIITNPQTGFHENEIRELVKFTDRGGNILVTLSPQFNENLLTTFYSFLEERGVKYINGMILDRLSSQYGAQASIVSVNEYNTNEDIFKQFSGRTMFPLAGIIEKKESPGYKVKSLISSVTFPATWGEKDFKELESGNVKYTEGVDLKGPLGLMISSINSNSGARLVVYSSSAFITNQLQGQASNFNLFLNSIGWLLNDKALISLDRPTIKGDLVYISDMQVTLISYFAVLFFPFIFIGLGLVQFRRLQSK